jgi:hypothetical protein
MWVIGTRAINQITYFLLFFANTAVLICLFWKEGTGMNAINDEWDIGEKVLQLLSQHRGQSHVERIVSVMTPGKTWRLPELARFSNMNEEDALRALRVLKDSEMVISLDADEEPEGTFWKRV